MNKYLLWVFLAFQSIPAYSHVFDFKEGTITVQDYFNKEEKTIPLNQYGGGELRLTPRQWEQPGDWNVQWMWDTNPSAGVTFDPEEVYVSVSLTSMFNFENTYGVASSGWIDKGTYQFPPHTNTAIGYCELPQILQSDTFRPDGNYAIEVEGSAKISSTGRMSTIRTRCIGYYEIRKHVAINLVDTVINLAGSTPAALSGSTRLNVSGFGGPVTVRIVNPNTDEVLVSFDPNNHVTSTTMDLIQQPQYEQQIYVRANTSVPGRHEYRVQLIGEFK